MAFIEEKATESNIVRYYKLNQLKTAQNAVNWISYVRYLRGMVVDYIYFDDQLNRSDEGSDSIQLFPFVSVKEMEHALDGRHIDAIYITGNFDYMPVVIGIDLNTFNAYISLRKKLPADVEKLEQMLNLR